MRKLTIASAVFWLLTIPGCGNEKTVYRSTYDGLQKREQIVKPGVIPDTSPGTSFDQYSREREEILHQPK